MPEHDPRHEELIEAILVGNGATEELRSQIEGCRVCENKLEELEFVRDLLTTTGGAEDLSAETLPAFPAGEEAARQCLRQLAAEEFGAPRPARRRWHPLLLVGTLAAAALLVFALSRVLDGNAEPDRPEDVFIGEDAPEFLTPGAAPVKPTELVFTWSGALEEEDDVFVLRIRDEAGNALSPSPVRVSEDRWTPPAEVVASWPDVFQVQVAVEGFLREPSTSTWHVVRLAR